MKKLIIGFLGVLLLLPFSVSAADFTKDLKYGTKGIEVKQMQEFLRDKGIYKGPITGNFLSLSLAAVKTFQKDNNVKVTGLWNKETRELANNLLNPVEQVSSKPDWYDEWVKNYIPPVAQPVQIVSNYQPIVYQNSVTPSTISSSGIQNEQSNGQSGTSEQTTNPPVNDPANPPQKYDGIYINTLNNNIIVESLPYDIRLGQTVKLTDDKTVVTVAIDGQIVSQVVKNNKFKITVQNLEPSKEYKVKVTLTGQEYANLETTIMTKSGIRCSMEDGRVSCSNDNTQDIKVKAVKCKIYFSDQLTINWNNGTLYEKKFSISDEVEIPFPSALALPGNSQPVYLFLAFNGTNNKPCTVSKFDLNGREFIPEVR